MKRSSESRSARQPALQPATDSDRGFWADFREIIVPTNKWHYAFHAVVIAVALAYWIGSLIFLKASWAEIVMYRPGGDNQVWPVVTALSHFNFGDPTDALKYGQGIGGFHAVILLPHAMAYAIFGAPGYMITDAVYSWCYFVAAAMLFRRWGLGGLSSIVLSAAVSTLSLHALLQKVSVAFAKLVGLFGLGIAEWNFPDLINLSIAGKRLPRPFPTEILVVLILYFFVRQWQDRRAPTLKRGLAVGALMGVLMQGDPYSFAALGLLSLVVLARNMSFQKWKVPWRFGAGALIGVTLVGWYFVVQMLGQNPDGAVRFGLATYPRSKIMLLPHYGPWLRLLLVTCFIIVIRVLVYRCQMDAKSSNAKTSREPGGTLATGVQASAAILNVNTSMAFFALSMVTCAWLAQPVQLLLLGKGAQIYHYFIYTLPTFYSYAVILLLIRLFKILAISERHDGETRLVWPRRVTSLLCGSSVAFMFILGIEEATDAIRHLGVSRRDGSPWIAIGDDFRPNLRSLDREFRENPALKDTRTFATLCQEVNFLLTAFHEKRAYLPDNGFTTLSDEDLEQRLFEVAKIFQIKPGAFASMIQDWYTLNYWLGCAKYWCRFRLQTCS